MRRLLEFAKLSAEIPILAVRIAFGLIRVSCCPAFWTMLGEARRNWIKNDRRQWALRGVNLLDLTWSEARAVALSRFDPLVTGFRLIAKGPTHVRQHLAKIERGDR